jgi:hypothetical protein
MNELRQRAIEAEAKIGLPRMLEIQSYTHCYCGEEVLYGEDGTGMCGICGQVHDIRFLSWHRTPYMKEGAS